MPWHEEKRDSVAALHDYARPIPAHAWVFGRVLIRKHTRISGVAYTRVIVGVYPKGQMSGTSSKLPLSAWAAHAELELSA